MTPLAIDLYCGLGGWTEGLLAEGWDVVGFDIERHAYGEHRYPAQLVLQDVRTIDGAQFARASLIVASSPCQEFSYRAMPWKRAKALGPPLLGMELFAQAERIQREAIAAAGHFIPMVQENVQGAQKWVGRARWHYGSYYLWGDVPALMPITLGRSVMKDGVAHRSSGETNFHGIEQICRNVDSVNGPCGHERRYHVFEGGLHFCQVCIGTGAMHRFTPEERATKNDGGSWFNVAHNTESGHGQNPDGRRTNGRDDDQRDLRWVSGDEPMGASMLRGEDVQMPGVPGSGSAVSCDGIKVPSDRGRRTDVGNGARFTTRDCDKAIANASEGRKGYASGTGNLGKSVVSRMTSSKSSARKAASARIAKIPLPLARHIASVYYPKDALAGIA